MRRKSCSRRSTGSRSLPSRLLALALIAAIAGCGQSAADKAANKVCDARADIQKQVTTLKNLTPTTASLDKARSSITAIRNDVKKIVDAQSDLKPERKKAVEAANKEFSSQFDDALTSFATSGSLSAGAKQLQAALTKLGDSYVAALGKIDC
jgi:Tfp pilus assembly protein PilP